MTLRDTRRGKGLCIQCAAPSPVKNRCPSCSAKQAAYQRDRAQKLIARGKCRYCGTQPLVPGKTACVECLMMYNSRVREYKRESSRRFFKKGIV